MRVRVPPGVPLHRAQSKPKKEKKKPKGTKPSRAGRVLQFLESQKDRTKFWTVVEIKEALGFRKVAHMSMGSTLFSLTSHGKLQRLDGVGPRGGFGYRALPLRWPDESRLRKDILKLMQHSPPQPAAEISLKISGCYTEPPCSVVLIGLILRIVDDEDLEVSPIQRNESILRAPQWADLRLPFGRWMLTLAGAPVA